MTDLAAKYKTYRLLTPFQNEIYTSNPSDIKYQWPLQRCIIRHFRIILKSKRKFKNFIPDIPRKILSQQFNHRNNGVKTVNDINKDEAYLKRNRK